MDSDIKPTVYADRDLSEQARESAARLGLTIVYETPDKEQSEPFLWLDSDGLSLIGGGAALRGDFSRMRKRIKAGNLRNELLVRAAKIKGADRPLSVIDATAGLGEDSFLLAAAGFSVRLYEYNPIISLLLRDALRRAAATPELSEIVGRMSFSQGDSISALAALDTPPDVVFLDPMFPARQKSGLVKKKFQLLQSLERPCTNENELFAAAAAAQPQRIVIKRPLKGPYLAGIKPDYSIEGNGIRYDCHTLQR